MNLQTSIKRELWNAISKSYESGVYSSAILDAIHFLTDTIREKSGLDGDGHSLIGQAFSGDSPKIRINKFQTQTEKDEQKGFAELLRGIYSSIRNPRSHEQTEDKQENADAIIYFINYILSVVDTSKGPFVLEDWLDRIYDPDFVTSERYIDILIREIPPRRRVDAMINLYRGKKQDNAENIKAVLMHFSKIGTDIEISELLKVISAELRTERDEVVILRAIQSLPSQLWPRIDEDTRIRIENKLIRSIKSGKEGIEYRTNGTGRMVPHKVIGGAFGTWSRDLIEHFTLREELADAIYMLLRGQEQENIYVVNYFIDHLPRIAEYSSEKDMDTLMIEELIASIKTGHFKEFRINLTKNIGRLPEDWQQRIIKQTGPLNNPVAINDEDLPF